MKEVNSLCMDSRPLQVNTVLCHSTQYSFVVTIAVTITINNNIIIIIIVSHA